tara:strand:- start:914 stop:2074 length:1161 start_codon:yes stop_codon:yes gene_type:complete
MKKLFTLLALTISFSMNAQLVSVTEGNNNGQRLSISDATNHGDIGNNAVDLSYSNTTVSTGATGASSVALGENTTASGVFSTALGVGTQANGQGSTALGSGTVAGGFYATATGFFTTASGDYSTAMGFGAQEEGITNNGTPYYKNEASGGYSVVIGSRNKSEGFKSVSIGGDNLSSGTSSTAIGENNIATGDHSIAMGLFSESPALHGFAFGNNAYADGFNTVAVGSANTIDENAVSGEWNVNNRVFVVGNGYYDPNTGAVTRSDALTVLFDGTTTIAGDLTINSDARLKANIISLGSTLAKILQIDGKTYTMKKDENKKQKIGVLAQDVQKVFPELVSEFNGIKSVNYQGLVPVLINALKEQDGKIKEQEKRLKRLEELISIMDK